MLFWKFWKSSRNNENHNKQTNKQANKLKNVWIVVVRQHFFSLHLTQIGAAVRLGRLLPAD